jgi:tetratricopeptide (TPR) repeat protein
MEKTRPAVIIRWALAAPMEGGEQLHKRRFRPLLMMVVGCALLAGQGQAQDEGRTAPNEEPSSMDTLFDRSDTGNVVQSAVMSLSAGQRELKRAAKLEGRLGELEGKKLESTRANISQAYQNAIESFQDAIRSEPKMAEAYVGLSRALRAAGKFADALMVSSQGLKLAPESDDLFAGWAESIMGLDMLGDATRAYSQLKGASPARAELLMQLMKDWLSRRRVEPGEVSAADIDRLADWIGEQERSG